MKQINAVLWSNLIPIIILVLIIPIYLIAKYIRDKADFKETLEKVKITVEIGAFISAGIYFLYQLRASTTITNLDVKILTERHNLNRQNDYLKVTLDLTKGNVNSLFLHQIQGRIHVDGEDKCYNLIFEDYNSLKYVGDSLKFDGWLPDIKDSNIRKYRLGISETTTFSTYTQVPSGKACKIDIAIVGGSETLNYARSQWRASEVSLPIDTLKK